MGCRYAELGEMCYSHMYVVRLFLLWRFRCFFFPVFFFYCFWDFARGARQFKHCCWIYSQVCCACMNLVYWSVDTYVMCVCLSMSAACIVHPSRLSYFMTPCFTLMLSQCLRCIALCTNKFAHIWLPMLCWQHFYNSTLDSHDIHMV